jgi:hypothetical protein
MDEMELLMDSFFTTNSRQSNALLVTLVWKSEIGAGEQPCCSHCLGYQTLNLMTYIWPSNSVTLLRNKSDETPRLSLWKSRSIKFFLPLNVLLSLGQRLFKTK